MDFSINDYQDVSSICVCFTLIIGLFTYLRSVKMNRMDFYFKIKSDFSSDKSTTFIQSIWRKTIYLDEVEGRPYLKHRVTENGQLVEKELSLDLLNSIEDLCIFYEEGLISKKLLYEGFSSFIILSYECPKVQEFIEKFRKLKESDEYLEGNKKLYDIVTNYTPKKFHL